MKTSSLLMNCSKNSTKSRYYFCFQYHREHPPGLDLWSQCFCRQGRTCLRKRSKSLREAHVCAERRRVGLGHVKKWRRMIHGWQENHLEVEMKYDSCSTRTRTRRSSDLAFWVWGLDVLPLDLDLDSCLDPFWYPSPTTLWFGWLLSIGRSHFYSPQHPWKAYNADTPPQKWQNPRHNRPAETCSTAGYDYATPTQSRWAAGVDRERQHSHNSRTKGILTNCIEWEWNETL